jgi:hypothetical protein
MHHKITLFLLTFMVVMTSGCLLDRSAITCSDPSCFPTDADMSDAFINPDGNVPDAGVDAFIADADAGPMPDAWIDPDGGLDAGSDAGSDGGSDAGRPDGGGMRRCEDTTTGYCFRFVNLSGSPEVTGWMIQYNWTLPGGSLYRLPDNRDPEGIPVFGPACDVFRRIDATTTECEILNPDPGMTTIGAGPYYAYPVYAGGPACSSTGCPNYSAGYRMWYEGIEFSTAPADGRVSQASRPTTAGTIVVLRIIP